MFRKSFSIKSNTEMKGSDRKKLKLNVLKNFPLVPAGDLKEIFSTKDSVTSIKVAINNGEVVQIYCVNKIPILFTRGTKMYPTVYMLWEYPHILPYYTTHADVLPILQGGADLMVAGVALENGPVNEHSFGLLNKHDTVFVNLINNKAAIGVGETHLSSRDMYLSDGKGKCVIMLHIYGDALCSLSPVFPFVPTLGPVTSQYSPRYQTGINNTIINRLVDSNSNNAAEEKTSSEKKHGCRINSQNGSVNRDILPKMSDVVSGFQNLSASNEQSINSETEREQKNDINMDDLIKYCFLKSLKTSVKKVKLPILVSNFYKLHMISACPTGFDLNVKKSKYKKISKFIRDMCDENIIQSDDVANGVQQITSVNYSHNMLTSFVDIYDRSVPTTSDANQPKVCEKYTVTQIVFPLFSEFLIKKGNSLTPSDTRKYITEYIRKKDLHLRDQPLVRLDDTIKNILTFEKNANVSVADTMKWEDVIHGILSKMGQSYKISTSENSEFLLPKESKGKLPMIDLRIVKKSGNKKVTLVDNLELFGINVEEFSHECQIGAAASATVNRSESMKSAQFQIQGNQINCISKLLCEKYNIPKKYLRGLELAPPKKKK